MPATAENIWSGHFKYQLLNSYYPDNSIFYDYLGSNGVDNFIDGRVNWSRRSAGGRWDFNVDYQLIGIQGDSRDLPSSAPLIFPASQLPDDQQRFFDLSDTISDNNDYALVQRLDRLNVGYLGDKVVLRAGRQVLSWGHGLLFSAMDFFNPFDPTQFDKEYKSGDDMVYGQYLLDSGDDFQFVNVVRRNPQSDEVDKDYSSFAAKYHTLLSTSELDIVIASHYRDNLFGLGGNTALGGAVLSGEIMVTESSDNTYTSVIAGLSYSWIAWEKNVTGIVEYFHNGFGLSKIDSILNIASQPALLERLQRGELYTVGKDYAALSSIIELTPLLRVSPALFVNLQDSSSLVQVALNYDWSQNRVCLFALNLPVGAAGTEFGGLNAPLLDKYLSYDIQLVAKLSWYF